MSFLTKAERERLVAGRELTRALMNRLVAAVRSHGSYRMAAELCGVPGNRVAKWLSVGEEMASLLDDGVELDDESMAYAMFYLKMSKARAQFAQKLSEVAHKGRTARMAQEVLLAMYDDIVGTEDKGNSNRIEVVFVDGPQD